MEHKHREGILGPRGKTGTALAAAVTFVACSLLASSAAFSSRIGEEPTITGEPVVGETLVSSTPGDSGVYKWQRCDPSTATCEDAGRDDPNWSDIPGAEGPTGQAYTIPSADLGFFIRVLTKDTNLGTQFTPSAPVGPVTSPAAPPPPVEPAAEEIVPQHGIKLVGQTTGGSVSFKPPGQAGFTPLGAKNTIPVGSIVNTRKGRIGVTAATGEFGNTTPDEAFEYYGGLFKILQPPATNSVAIAKLVGKGRCGASQGSRKVKKGSVAQVSRRRKGRRLWGRGTGRYGTAGRGGTGSVVGTTYLTVEKCGGTFFKVPPQSGEGHGIKVLAKGKKKPVFLAPGERYFAER